jgi:hypothetical protein
MRKSFFFLTAVALVFSSCFITHSSAGTVTTYYGLYKPAMGEPGSTWWNLMNSNFDTIDQRLYEASPNYVRPEWFGAITSAASTQAALDAGTHIHFGDGDYTLSDATITDYRKTITCSPKTRLLIASGKSGIIYQPTVKTVPDLYPGFSIGTKEVPCVFTSATTNGGDAVRILSDASNSVTPYHGKINIQVHDTSGWAVYGGTSDISYPSYPANMDINVRADTTKGGVGGHWGDEIRVNGEFLGILSDPAVQVQQDGTGFHIDAEYVNNKGYDVDILKGDDINIRARIEQSVVKDVSAMVNITPTTGNNVSNVRLYNSVMVSGPSTNVYYGVRANTVGGGSFSDFASTRNYFESFVQAQSISGASTIYMLNNRYFSVTNSGETGLFIPTAVAADVIYRATYIDSVTNSLMWRDTGGTARQVSGLKCSSSWSVPSTATDASSTTTLTCAGAATGDAVSAGHTALTVAGDMLACVITSTDNVACTYVNKGPTRTPGAGTLYVTVKGK